MKGKLLLKLVVLAAIFAFLFSVFAPVCYPLTPDNSANADMPKTNDVFNGSFSPQEVIVAAGETFDVTFSICPSVDTPNTLVRFVLPANIVSIVSGNPVSTHDLKKGEPLTLTLSFKANVEADVYVKADVEASSSGKKYQSSYFLHVATSNVEFNSVEGGSTFEVSLEYESTASNPESSRATETEVEPAAGTFRIYGKWNYQNELGGYSPGRYMLVQIWDSDSTSGDDLLAQAWTNANGEFDITAPNEDGLGAGTADPYVRFIAEGEWDWISKDNSENTYWWRYPNSGTIQNNVPDNWVHNTGSRYPTSGNEALQAGDAVYQEAQWIFDRTGWDYSGKTTIFYPRGTWPYHSSGTINLPLKTTWAWTHVTVQHEEGHAVMYQLYGYMPSGTGPDPHYIMSESSNGFAFKEGWAEFMQAAVDNNPNNLADVGQNIEDNDWYNYYDSGDLDGAIVEGSVASIFWDILDPVDIAGDNDHMYWGFDEIFTVIRYDHPNSIVEFWNDWKTRWPTVSTSVGPLCDIYWNYGIDEDWPPWGTPWGGTISINGGATYTTSKTVTLALFCDDWGSGVHYMRFSEDYGATWGTWISYATTYTYTIQKATDGGMYIDVQFADYWLQPTAAGTIYDYIIVDTVNPTGSITINGGATYTTSKSVTLTLSATDATSGVSQMRFSENYGTTWGSWVSYSTTYAYTIQKATDGGMYIDVQFRDNAGRVSTAGGIYDYIIVDTVNPTGSITINAGNAYTTSTSVSLSLTYSDATSGVDKVRYGNAGGYWSAWENPSSTKAWTLIAGDGNKAVYYQVRDKAGRVSSYYYDTIVLDTVAPTGSIVINSGNPTTPTTAVTLSLTYADATSGVDKVRYANAGGSWSAWEAPSATKAWTLTAGAGTKTVYYQVRDKAGWVSPVYSDTITLLAPAASISVWTDKATYHAGETMKLYLRVKNPGAALPVRIVVALKLTDGSFYMLLDMTTTLPAGLDSGNVLLESIKLPSIPLGTYVWYAALLNPSSGAVISLSTSTWQMTAAIAAPSMTPSVFLQAKDQ